MTVTAAGRARLERRPLICPACGTAAYPADARVGLDGSLSPGATRLACTAAASWSFDIASARLAEFAGVAIDDETIRRHCHRAAPALARRREASPPAAAFAAAGGDVESLTDGVMAPTRGGWREVKMGRFQVRPRGEPAEPEDWASRDLPAPTAGVAYAAVADCETFSAWWGGRARAPGIDPGGDLTVLADGAAWIRAAAAVQSPRAERVLDIFHAGQHIAAAANAVHGEGTAAAADWLERGRRCLLADGWDGLCDHVGATLLQGARAGRARGLGHADGLLRGPYREAELRPSAEHRPVHRQRDGGGGGQEPGRQAEEADRGQVGGRKRRRHGRLVRPELQRPRGPLLGLTQLNARIHRRTRRPGRSRGREISAVGIGLPSG